MTNRSTRLSRILVALVFVISVSSVAWANPSPSQAQATPTAKAPEAEVKAVTAINTTADTATKLTMAEAFVTKYPKSTLRVGLAQYLAGEIARVTDDGQRLLLAEKAQKMFTGEAELNRIQPLVISGYIRNKRIDDAFSLGATALAKQPEDVGVLAALAAAGTEETRRQNPKYAAQSLQFGVKAIELIEANKKPASLDDATWTYQKSLLPHLYLDMGVLALATGKPAEAKPRFEKAIALNPTEPSAYFFMGGLIDDEYRVLAESFSTMPAGQQKQDTLKKAMELMDKVIDFYARALGAASGKPEFKGVYDQIMESITPYYKYRNKNSTDGLQQLIDKYKVPAVTP